MFTYDDAVTVGSTPRLPDYAGRSGVVVGIGDDEGNGPSYAIAFAEDEVTVAFWAFELEDTESPPLSRGANDPQHRRAPLQDPRS
ncbi:MAG TPA: hypothetical protein DCM67_07790 [Propionibacteriaceae bacterium]|nr:hypothetical protein [Propionibacteriaceae bacterium]